MIQPDHELAAPSSSSAHLPEVLNPPMPELAGHQIGDTFAKGGVNYKILAFQPEQPSESGNVPSFPAQVILEKEVANPRASQVEALTQNAKGGVDATLGLTQYSPAQPETLKETVVLTVEEFRLLVGETTLH